MVGQEPLKLYIQVRILVPELDTEIVAFCAKGASLPALTSQDDVGRGASGGEAEHLARPPLAEFESWSRNNKKFPDLIGEFFIFYFPLLKSLVRARSRLPIFVFFLACFRRALKALFLPIPHISTSRVKRS